jgi:hypothetical protein
VQLFQGNMQDSAMPIGLFPSNLPARCAAVSRNITPTLLAYAAAPFIRSSDF